MSILISPLWPACGTGFHCRTDLWNAYFHCSSLGMYSVPLLGGDYFKHHRLWLTSGLLKAYSTIHCLCRESAGNQGCYQGC